MKYHKIPPVGTPMELQKQDLSWLQSGLHEGINGLLKILGVGNYIISGVEEVGTNITDGWIYYNGELLRFKSGAINTKFVIVDQESTPGTGDFEKYATPGSNVGAIELSTLVRLDKIRELATKIQDLQTELTSLGDTVTANSGQIQDNIEAIANHDHDANYEPKHTMLNKYLNGYLNMGNGLQIRWGTWVSNVDGAKSVYFAEEFTTECFVVVFDEYIQNTTVEKYKDHFVVNRADGVPGTQMRNYIAIGY